MRLPQNNAFADFPGKDLFLAVNDDIFLRRFNDPLDRPGKFDSPRRFIRLYFVACDNRKINITVHRVRPFRTTPEQDDFIGTLLQNRCFRHDLPKIKSRPQPGKYRQAAVNKADHIPAVLLGINQPTALKNLDGFTDLPPYSYRYHGQSGK